MEESRAVQKYTAWINAKKVDPLIRRELLNIISSPEDITERFSENLTFGTAGLRAVMGAGTNRINIYTVASAAKGLAACLQASDASEEGVIVCYDSRNHSKDFAEITARVLACEGIKVYLSDRLRPVPMLSFGIRHYRTAGGVMITASHNPREYNGFKVYGNDGGQLSPAGANAVQERMPEFEDVVDYLAEMLPLEDYVQKEQVTYLGKNWDDDYMEMLHGMKISQKLSQDSKARLRIVYTPLNGAGAKPVLRVLNENGFRRVFMVSEQEKPDGNFPTLQVPNPEREDSFALAKKYARAVAADVIIATDPDSDRLGVAVPDDDGGYQMLTGNQIGLLLMEYILATKSARGELSENDYCITSVVSSNLARVIAERYNVKLIETLTGSRHFAECIRNHEAEETGTFRFGFEEGNGFMFHSEVRDKDAVAACLAIAEMAAVSKSYGLCLMDQLKAIYRLYGYAAEKNVSIDCSGPEGTEKIRRCMDHYRLLNGKLGAMGKDLYYRDVKTFIDRMPESNLLIYELNDMDWIAIRPSGTEPKLKVYFGFYGEKTAAESRLNTVSAQLIQDIREILDQK
ncbi:MAG: phospho-sugar mutase [Clostridia bacterium]|uniref:Phosphoglucomutase n=1 Tax=Mogibacterium kristiansenii TaxID=2606708 RepID=A0A6N7X2C8_9FIRM|nr:phospho-sugar mutase [Mogibacterium kristiansenii]MDD6699677.1 phospho-sugar mutase [Mogibacterium kristiansenii]MDY5450583.1 phospho-sugar mutase [Clostridia bacterium]MEE0369904.1 phospho-sugar mutase [Clostridia bacterium]MST69827.1 phospho-sugar mutase [Mogibacterium kristiansenii]